MEYNRFLIFIDTHLELVASNSDKTLNRTLNLVYNLYSSNQNETVLIDFGDYQTQKLLINSSKTLLILMILKYWFQLFKF